MSAFHYGTPLVVLWYRRTWTTLSSTSCFEAWKAQAWNNWSTSAKTITSFWSKNSHKDQFYDNIQSTWLSLYPNSRGSACGAIVNALASCYMMLQSLIYQRRRCIQVSQALAKLCILSRNYWDVFDTCPPWTGQSESVVSTRTVRTIY